MNRNGLIVLVIIVTCAAASRLGQSKRASGRSVSPRVTVTLMATAWAMGWLAIGLPSFVEGSLSASLSEQFHAVLALLAFATTPLLIILAAGWLPRLNAREISTDKKTIQPHPLD